MRAAHVFGAAHRGGLQTRLGGRDKSLRCNKILRKEAPK